ncbi:MBL fold metallo-hydrolase [Candidatus Thorarchaeota archaeon]|nr:MAG: MBL fold metallo-hydrolase [Candidatus Thorarchaeota archaeon]
MKVTLLGTGTSYPDPERVQSGILVEIEDKPILLDVGSGILHRLLQVVDDVTKIQHVFLSHFHIDHCSDFVTLCQTLWLSGLRDQVNIYGPPVMDQWWEGVFDTAFPYLKGRFPIVRHKLSKHDQVKINEASVRCVPSCHGDMDSRAYRIDWKGKSVVYSSDTAPCDEIADFAKGVDLLIHECNWLDGEHEKRVHTSPTELAAIVAHAEPLKVALVHLSPSVVGVAESVLSIVKGTSDTEVMLGHDLMEIDV